MHVCVSLTSVLIQSVMTALHPGIVCVWLVCTYDKLFTTNMSCVCVCVCVKLSSIPVLTATCDSIAGVCVHVCMENVYM